MSKSICRRRLLTSLLESVSWSLQSKYDEYVKTAVDLQSIGSSPDFLCVWEHSYNMSNLSNVDNTFGW